MVTRDHESYLKISNFFCKTKQFVDIQYIYYEFIDTKRLSSFTPAW